MIQKPRIGLLPLYLALYDESLPTLRGELEPFLRQVQSALAAAGAEVTAAPVCCVSSEVRAGLEQLRAGDPDLLVTLHLAYSPSLESARALAECGLPILMLDTTPDAEFGRDVDPQRLLYNHGIHGVMDLASVLRRLGCQPWVVAGHLNDPATAGRAVAIGRAARAWRRMRGTRALRIGPVFDGMGDFQVEPARLRAHFGIEVEQIEALALAEDAAAIDDAAIEAERKADEATFDVDCPAEVHRRSLRVGLALRRRLDRGGFTAFSLNFGAFDRADGPIDTVPFLECCKAMARGIGYAGEGDVLTAALVGALATAFGGTTFTEIFCPDWRGGALFLSHMGELNPEVTAAPARLYEKPFPFTPARNPATLAAAIRPGAATLVDLAPGPDGFSLIVAPVQVLEDGTHPGLRDWIRAWIQPALPLTQFLERYSALGGTHHHALMLGDHREALTAFARMAGIEFHWLGE